MCLFLPFFEMTQASEYKFLKRQVTGNQIKLYGVTNAGTETLLNTYIGSDNYISESFEVGHIEQYEGKLFFDVNEHTNAQNDNGTWPGAPSSSYVLEYDFLNKTFTKKVNAPDDFQLYPKAITEMIL